MIQLKCHFFILAFCGLFIHSDAKKTCPKGMRVDVRQSSGCADCSPKFYQPVENTKQTCFVCSSCDVESGSEETATCTRTENTKCRCRRGFVASDSDSSTCKCDIGSGLKYGECSKCADGFFSDRIDSPCQEWTKCKTGVKVNGTKASDVICNEESNPIVTKETTSNRNLAVITPTTPRRPHEGAEVEKGYTAVTTKNRGTSAQGPPTPPQDDITGPRTSATGNHIVMFLLICGVVLLLVLTPVICRMHIAPRHQWKPAIQTQDSLCQRPVEESGDDSRSSLKQFPVEP